ncbi:MAG TPA: helix-hairpin-helix domain-containing protein, partial [Micromonosporaceae bacterium]
RIEAVAARAAVDDFTRIYGIGPKCAAALVGAGIRTYEQLAAANGAQIAAALRDAGLRLAANLRTWPSQARSLAYGNRPPLRRRTRVEPGPMNDREPAVDENGHEHNGRADRYAHPDRRPPAKPAEHSGATKHTSPGTHSHRSVPPDAFDPDDLARIEGIGPRVAAAFVAAGVRTFAQLAATDVAALRQAIVAAGLVPVPSLPTWPAQARLLADGDEDGFAVMSARLIAGRDVRDDLERIEGIGPQIGAALRVAGLHTFRALANSDSGRLRTAIERAGLSTAPHLTTWPAQARLLADGDEDGFAELTKRLADGHDDRRR